VYIKITDPQAQCDLCGKKPPEGEIFKSEKYICLCKECVKKLDAMPVKSKENIEEYLIGNVI
jgi:hypothetical protein